MDAAPEAGPEIIRRIAALLARAADESSTPAEAAMAIDRASRLMRQYNLSRDDVEMRKEGTKRYAHDAVPAGSVHINKLVVAISRLAHCRAGHRKNGESDHFSFSGLKVDVDYAEWLLRTCIACMERGWTAYQPTLAYGALLVGGATPAAIRDAWRTGFTAEVCSRIKAMTDPPETALVVLKAAIIEEDFGPFKGTVTRMPTVYTRNTASAFALGKAEGSRVALRQEVDEDPGNDTGGNRLDG